MKFQNLEREKPLKAMQLKKHPKYLTITCWRTKNGNQATLLILEKTANGHGTLSGGEVQEFEIITGRILSEHNDELIMNGRRSLDQDFKSLNASLLLPGLTGRTAKTTHT